MCNNSNIIDSRRLNFQYVVMIMMERYIQYTLIGTGTKTMLLIIFLKFFSQYLESIVIAAFC